MGKGYSQNSMSEVIYFGPASFFNGLLHGNLGF